MSISTKTGDAGETGLIGGRRVGKGDPRVEAYGTIDELGAHLAFARSICPSEKIGESTRVIQKELFTLGGALTGGESGLRQEMVDALTRQVDEIEGMEGILGDWALPGGSTPAAAYEVARAVCRRAERVIVRLAGEGEKVDPLVIAYLNRLSDLLWLFSRQIEREAGVDSRLRDGKSGGPSWSRAW
jgi:cob(I)alamin adenosyltransferase